MWQDIVLAATLWVLLAALIPTVLKKTEKPAFSSSILIGTGLLVISFTNATLDLWNAALATALTSATWFFLAYQRYRLNKSNSAR